MGDIPLDVLNAAVRQIADEYRVEWNRLPTRTEWEMMLHSALGGGELDPAAEVFCEEGWASAVQIDFKSA